MKKPMMRKHVLLATLLLLALTLTLALSLISCAGSPEETFVFTAPGGVDVSIGSGDTVIEELGAYVSLNESASCGGIPGKDRVYTYEGFRVKTTPAAGGGNEVCQIELTDDSLQTPEGLYIGMSVEEAKAAMSGHGTYAASGAGFSYTKGNCKLQISVRGDVVSGIAYLTA